MATRSKTNTEETVDQDRGGDTDRPAGGRRSRKPGAADENDPLGGLLAGLEEAMPGVEVLDRELVLEGGGRADVAGVDPSGRLVLVLVVAGDPERAILETLDLFGFARANTAILARHLGGRQVNPLLPPRIAVVDSSGDTTLIERLSALTSQGLEIFGVKKLQSAGGKHAYLVPVGRTVAGGPGGATIAGEGGVEAFLRSLPASMTDLARRLTDRMARLDEELDAAADRTTIIWRFQGEVLARLERAGHRLLAGAGPHQSTVPLSSAEDVERVVEEALGRLVELIGLPEPSLSTPLREGPVAIDDGPLLTPEEIEAFRD